MISFRSKESAEHHKLTYPVFSCTPLVPMRLDAHQCLMMWGEAGASIFASLITPGASIPCCGSVVTCTPVSCAFVMDSPHPPASWVIHYFSSDSVHPGPSWTHQCY